METDVALDYKIVGKGWAECRLDFYGMTFTVTASYLSDALLELISGTNHILAGGSEARFSFDEEPGEFRWIMHRTHDGGLAVKILDFPELWGHKPDEEGAVLMDVTCQIRGFAMALLSTLNVLLLELGVSGYRDKWGNSEFPSTQYRVLCEHLGELPSPHLKSDTRKTKGSKRAA